MYHKFKNMSQALVVLVDFLKEKSVEGVHLCGVLDLLSICKHLHYYDKCISRA